MGIEDVLARWFELAKGSRVDVVIADRIFGGRPGESSQTPTFYQFLGGVIQIGFGTTERLTVTSPDDVAMGPNRELIVGNAADGRFGWHYYGRPQTPENWCEDIYHRVGDVVRYTSLGPVNLGYEEFEYLGREFVKLV